MGTIYSGIAVCQAPYGHYSICSSIKPWGVDYFYAHFIDEATEAPRENLSEFVHSYTTEMIHTGWQSTGAGIQIQVHLEPFSTKYYVEMYKVDLQK